MKRSITFGGLLILLTVFCTLSFKPADNEKKDYVTINFNGIREEISMSFSNGTYKLVDFLKPQGKGDQTQLLKLINEQEAVGYKLVSYNCEIHSQNTAFHVTTVLLSK
jgi:hypothetical protein